MALRAASVLVVLGIVSLAPVRGAAGQCFADPPPPQTRLLKSAHKGVELYSFLGGDGTLQWSMLWGTNRNKTQAEIRSAPCSLHSMEELKEALGRLAVGEHVFWMWDPKVCPFCSYPARETIDALIGHARSVGVCLTTGALCAGEEEPPNNWMQLTPRDGL
jgi:hypothetical protein